MTAINISRILKILVISAMVQAADAQSHSSPFSTTEIAGMERKFAETLQNNRTVAAYSKASDNFDIHYLQCKWTVDPGVRFIRGSVRIGFTMTKKSNTITLDLADQLRVDSILFRTVKITHYKPFDSSIIVNLGNFLEAGAKESIEIFYAGVPPTGGVGSFSLGTHGGVPVLWTLSQPYGARDWWPCKNGLDDKVDSMDVQITTPDKYTSSGNGSFVGETVSAGQRTTTWKHRYPIATYLVAFAASNYRVIHDQVQLGNTTMPIMEHAYPERAGEMINASPSTKRTLQLLHNAFGPYPFIKERYGHTHVNFGGGMEHQTNSFMGNMNEGLIVHEAAHQWFGNKVTTGSWQDIWLNEGFAVFCTNLYYEKFFPGSFTLSQFRQQVNNITSVPNGSVFVKDTTSISRIFSSRLSYNKGAWVLHMLRWKLGDSVFFRACRNYLNDSRLAYAYAKTPDLIMHFEKESGTNLKKFFDDWVYREGFPSYQLRWATAGNAWVQTNLSQVTSDSSVKFFEMPVPVRFKNISNDTTIVIDHRKNGQINFFQIGFLPDSAFIDPEYKLISANNTVNRVEIFPESGNVAIFPNPVGNEFSILLKKMSEGELHISIFSNTGQLVYRRRTGNFRGNDFIVIPSHHFSPGIYWVRIEKDNDPVIVKRIVK